MLTFVVSGSLAFDRIMDFPGRFRDHILPEKIHLLNVSFGVERFTEHFGGTAGNIAYNLALLGARPTIVAAAGSDFSPYRRWLTRNRVDLSGVQVDGDERTAAAYIITDRDDNQITGFHVGAMRSPGRFPVTVARRAALAIVSPGNLGDMLALPGRYRRMRVPYWFDPGQQLTSMTGAQLRSAVNGAQGLIANDYEVTLALKKMGWTMRQLLHKTQLVVTTLGPKGSKVQQGSAVITVPPAKPKSALDPTGAGDAFRSGFLFGLASRWPIPVAARFGGLTAVYTVEAYGTQTHRFTWADLRKRYRKNFHADLPR